MLRTEQMVTLVKKIRDENISPDDPIFSMLKIYADTCELYLGHLLICAQLIESMCSGTAELTDMWRNGQSAPSIELSEILRRSTEQFVDFERSFAHKEATAIEQIRALSEFK